MNKKSVQQVGNPSSGGKDLKGAEKASDFPIKMDRAPCIHKNLKRIMDAQGLTIQKLSKKCKVPRSTIHNALAGRVVSMTTAHKLASGLGVSLSALVYGDEENTTAKVSAEDLLSGIFEIVVRKHIQK